MAKNLFTLTVKTTTPADSELLVGGTGSANAYNFTWTKLYEWLGIRSDGTTSTITGDVLLPNGLLRVSENTSTFGYYGQLDISTGGVFTIGAQNALIEDKETSINFNVKNVGGDFLAMTIANTGNVSMTNDLAADGTAIDFVTSGTVLTVGVGADNGTVSAGIFTDRTKHFDGNGLNAIKAIKGENGEIDHETLPEFARVHLKKKTIIDKKEVEIIEEGRDLGGMISILTKGLQEQITINKDLTDRIKQLEDVK